MKKKLFLVLVTALVSISVFAQDVTLATLQQGETTQLFYGSDGFLKALDAANDGDVITLSAGTFHVKTITKAVKVFGAGYTLNVDKGIYPTVLDRGFDIILPNGKEGLLLEGFCSYSNIETRGSIVAFTFRKLRVMNIIIGGQSKNGLIDQCRVAGWIYPDRTSDNLHITNTIADRIHENSTGAILTIENSIFGITSETTALLRNNRIVSVYDSYSVQGSLKNTCKAYNNSFKNGNSDGLQMQSGNTTVDDITLFGREIASYSDQETYELTTSAKTTYLGTDGTQIGIYGGSSPFTITPSNPQIVLKKIDQKSTSDGKLNVSFKVEAQKN